jgi:MFS family permease
MAIQRTLLPLVGVVFTAFLVIGIAMPVLPLHVHQGLGLGTFIVGLVAGSQFAASVVSRVWAGRHSDSRGAKHAVVTGLVISAAAGVLYLLSLTFVNAPAVSVSILLLGRGLLGAGESFIITGAQAWASCSAARRIPVGSSRGWVLRCMPRSRSARPWAPRFTAHSASYRSP